MAYLPRIADQILAFRLRSKGGVLIEGPKWCGKTSTALQTAASVLDLANPSTLAESKAMAQINPTLLLNGETPRLVDEWQEIPQLWDAGRSLIDRRQSVGQLIFTGSAVPADRSEILHSGTGRFSRMTMRTMSLFESGESTGEISLKALFDGEKSMVGTNNIDLEGIAYLICRGGWPMASVMTDREAALRQAIDYYDAVVNFDIGRVDGSRRSPLTARRLMRSYSRHIGLQSALTTIRDDMGSNGEPLDISTVTSYLEALRHIFVIEEMEAWNPNLRSKTAIRTTPTRYFTDPSIGCAALGCGPGDLINDLKAMGMLFENLCVRDLRIYADALDGQVYHYHDANGLECDSVVHLRNGRYGLVEIKLGGQDAIEAGAVSLGKLASKIDTTLMPEPSFKMVLTAVGNYAYCRPDGVWVVPVGCLRD